MQIRNNLVVILFLFLAGAGSVSAETYKLAVQPILPMIDMSRQYDPLTEYLTEQTGHKFLLLNSRNFMTYWSRMKGLRGFDLVLDAAHFTDYRVQRHGYQVLAKIPDTVSFAVVTRDDQFIIDMDELVGKRIATMPSPGLGAIRLEQMFPDKNRQPEYVKVPDSSSAIQDLLAGKVDAAIIPTLLVKQYTNLNTVTTTEPVPHMAFSVSPDMPNDVVEKIKKALLNADKTEVGKKMLKEMVITRFEPAGNDEYKGYMELLKDAPGY